MKSVPDQFECLILKVDLGGTPLIVSAIYRPPNAPQCATAALSSLLADFAHYELIIMGDLNLDWLTSASDDLKDICNDLNLTQLITEPTRPNFKNPAKSSLIDIILTNKPHKYLNGIVFPIDASDHCPIACIRNVNTPKSSPRFIVKRNIKHLSSSRGGSE